VGADRRFTDLAGGRSARCVPVWDAAAGSRAVRGICFGNVGREMEWLVRFGEFDRMLVRPMSPLVQVAVKRIPINDFGNLIGGLGVFLIASSLVAVDLVAGGHCVPCSGGTGRMPRRGSAGAGAGPRSRFGSSAPTRSSRLSTTVNNRFGSYPLHIFGDLARFVLTFGVPVAFIAYLPATVLLGRTGELSVHPALAYGRRWLARRCLSRRTVSGGANSRTTRAQVTRCCCRARPARSRRRRPSRVPRQLRRPSRQ